MASNKRVLMVMADGSEEYEAMSISNPLVRSGCQVITASIYNDRNVVACSRTTQISCQNMLKDIVDQEFDLVVLPGGMPGATNLAACPALMEKLKNQMSAGKWVAAICASPAVVLADSGLITTGTCYPVEKFKSKFKTWVDGNVVIDGKVVTSKGPGTAVEFGLTLVELLVSSEMREKVANAMLLPQFAKSDIRAHLQNMQD